jgi:beta-aspartyl-peptidase (threonine type)
MSSSASQRAVARDSRWALAIHGGAGMAREEVLDAAREDAAHAALRGVLERGARVLAAGGTSLDAVEQAARELEDSPLFNAGKGAAYNAAGEHELDASIMDGRDLRAGAVACVRGIKNPIALARLVMDRSPHVLLQSDGALAFARLQGVELVAPEYFRTEESWQALERARARQAAASKEHGTIGAVALDVHGDLAAATSTGGITNKMPGRVGDSAVIGAGTYASNASCAVSCTGTGEFFIRATVARDVCALVEYGRIDARAATRHVIERRLARIGGRGGVIVVDRNGRIACAFNTDILYRGAVTSDQPATTAIHEP